MAGDRCRCERLEPGGPSMCRASAVGIAEFATTGIASLALPCRALARPVHARRSSGERQAHIVAAVAGRCAAQC